jgi:hypothetical protein
VAFLAGRGKKKKSHFLLGIKPTFHNYLVYYQSVVAVSRTASGDRRE